MFIIETFGYLFTVSPIVAQRGFCIFKLERETEVFGCDLSEACPHAEHL